MPAPRPSLLAALLLVACSDPAPRKIRLAEGPSNGRGAPGTAQAKVLQVSSRERRQVGVLDFENATDDPALDWLERGLADLLVSQLGQSGQLVVVPPARLAEGARSADTTLAGRFFRAGAELVIEVDLRSAQGAPGGRERVGGMGLEQVFAMMAELSEKVEDRLRQDSAAARSTRPAEPTTTSVEAFRRYTRARTLREKLLYPEALAELDAAVAADPVFAPAWLLLASMRLQLADHEGGRQALEKARALQARLSGPGRLELRLTQATLERDAAAIRRLREEIASEAPQEQDLRRQVASLLDNHGEVELAREEFETLLEEDPRCASCYNSLAYLYAYRGDFTSALRLLEKYRELTPGEPNALDSIGEILALSGRFEEAIRAFEGALARWPTFWNSAARLTEIHADLGQLDRALDHSRRWAEIASSPRIRSEALYRRATILWRYGRREEAWKTLAEARQADPSLPWSEEIEAILRTASGDVAGSRRAWGAWLEAVRARQERLASDPALVGVVMDAAFSPGAPQEEIAELLAALALQPQPAAQLHTVRVVRGLLLSRTGQLARARDWFHGPGGESLKARLMERRVPRGLWRELLAAAQRESARDGSSRIAAILGEVSVQAEGRPEQARFAAARALLAAGPAGFDKVYASLGLPAEEAWRVAGPYPAPAPYTAVFPPEARDAAPVAWQPVPDRARDGWLDLAARFGPTLSAAAYAQVAVTSPGERVVQVHLGFSDSIKLWLNGEPVWQAYRKQNASLDDDVVKVILRAGENRLLVKTFAGWREWGVKLRVTDERGAAVAGLRFHAPGGGSLAALSGR